MKNDFNYRKDITSRLERVLGRLLSPHIVGQVVVFVSVSLLVLSVVAPQQLLFWVRAGLEVGQNTMLALTSLGLALLAESSNRNKLFGQVFAALAFVLAGIALVQLTMGYYPADGWFRVFYNTVQMPSQWAGRMSWITACIVLLLSIAQASRLWDCRCCLVVSSIFTAIAAYLSITGFTLNLVGLELFAHLDASQGALSSITGTLLLLISISSGRAILMSRAYLHWESAHPGEGVFVRVSALLSMLLVASIVAAASFTLAGLWSSAMLALLLMAFIGFLVIYQRIVSVVDAIVETRNYLRERELLLAQAQTQAKLGSWRVTLPKGDLEWSTECYRIFDMDHSRPITLDKVVEKIHHDDRAFVQAAWRRAISGEVLDIEHRVCVGDDVRWVHQRAELRWEQDHARCVCLGTVQDMSAAKRKELELLTSRERIRMLAAHNEHIKEQERRSIARELHDELGQHLTALRFQLELLQTQFGDMDARLRSGLESAKNGLRNLMDVSRQVASNLRPPALDAGLPAAAAWLLRTSLDKSGIKYQVTSNVDDDQLEDSLKTMIFRTLQESVTNVLKHAQASEVNVELHQSSEQLTVKIADNGVGFSLDEVDYTVQFGLAGIRERVLMFNGVVSIESEKGFGATITLMIPANHLHKRGAT